MAKDNPFKLIINEGGNLEHRWIPDPSKEPNVTILGPALKDADGNWERPEWMELQPDNSVNINPYTKESILDAEAAAEISAPKPEKEAEAEPSDQKKKQACEAKLRALDLSKVKSMAKMQEILGDILVCLELK